jgi:hypothetical protein
MAEERSVIELVYGGGSPGTPMALDGGVAVACGVNEGRGVTTIGVFWISVAGAIWMTGSAVAKARSFLGMGSKSCDVGAEPGPEQADILQPRTRSATVSRLEEIMIIANQVSNWIDFEGSKDASFTIS